MGAASSWLGWAYVRQVARVLRSDAETLALVLRRTPANERLLTLLDRSAPNSFEHTLAAEALAAASEDATVAAVNFALSEIDHSIASRARWPATGLRIALFSAGLAAFVAYLTDPSVLRWPLAILAVGVVAALVCAQAGRTGDRLAAQQRRAIDSLVSAALSLPAEASTRAAPPADPGRRRRRGGRQA